MEITCGSCATKLNVPEASLPKGVPVVTGTCPKCKAPIEIRVPPPSAAGPSQEAAPAPAPPPPAAPAPAPAPPPPPPPAPAPAPAPMALDEDFVEGRRLAMACFNEEKTRNDVKAELEALGFFVHAPPTNEEAVARIRKSKYEVLLLQEDYGGAIEKNEVSKVISPMAMSLRRHMLVGLVGKNFRTMDNMLAFAKSVHFVVAERELDKIKSITRHALTDNDQFYSVFREALREAGKT